MHKSGQKTTVNKKNKQISIKNINNTLYLNGICKQIHFMKKIALILPILLCSYLYGQIVQFPLSITYKLDVMENLTPPMEDTEDMFITEEMLNDPNLQEDPAIVHYKENLLIHQNDKNGLISLYLLFENTDNLKYIHYKLGRTQGTNDILEGTAEFDDYSMKKKVVFSRVKGIENQIRLDLGLFMDIGSLYGEFQIEDNMGNRSTVIFKENHL